MDYQTFFQDNPAPSNIEIITTQVEAFLNANAGKKVVLVTSGGTIIPFERNTVRFIDNFSQGTRGSASTEYFLQQDNVSVIFLYRSTTLRPFLRHFAHTNFLDMLEMNQSSPTLQIRPDHEEKIKAIWTQYQKVRENDRLLELAFTTLTDYLWYLKTICQAFSTIGPRALLYLAAAVSDFYIPRQEMAEHKLQSSEGAPSVQLQMVPKMLAPLVKDWVPEAFVVSFKLETDESILLAKAYKALDTYQHRIVVANLLHSRKERVILVQKNHTEENIVMSPRELEEGHEIEEKIVKSLMSNF